MRDCVPETAMSPEAHSSRPASASCVCFLRVLIVPSC